MSGFDKEGLEAGAGRRRDEVEAPIVSPVSWDEVQRRVAEAHYLRSVYFAEWMKRTARSWGSVFRRPGRAVPSSADKVRWQAR